MKRLISLALLAVVLGGCVSLSGDPNSFLDEILGPFTSDGTSDSGSEGDSTGGGGSNAPASTVNSPSQVFVTAPDVPQVGARVPEIAAALSIRVISQSRIAADVTVRFMIGQVEVHLTQLHIPPFGTVDAIGPDQTLRAEIVGTYETGEPTPPLVLELGQQFVEGDVKEYIIPDPNDACLDDPDKYEPGVCGCGIPDTDSDGDGVADCKDACPNDPNKTAPGVCDCGTADTDSDGDGTPDCKDECPNNPNKTAPGTCGCAKAEGTCGGQTGGGGGGGEPTEYSLTVSISPTGAGTVSHSPSAGPFAAGTEVMLSAKANSGYLFDHWEGDASGTDISASIVMDANKSVTAVFGVAPPVAYALNTATSPLYSGYVSRSPDAPGYDAGTPVNLLAIPSPGYVFDHWEGDANGTNVSTSVVMNADKSVTAVFVIAPPVTYTLNIATSPLYGGYVSRSPDAPGYDAGTPVDLLAMPNYGYVFDHWEGDASGTVASTSVVMDADKSVTAFFVPAPEPAPRLYVKADAPPAGNGRTWATAFTDLQAALADARDSGGITAEIWVAAGTYTPAGPGGDRSATFQLLNGVGIYGGFAGGEAILELRDWVNNVTILSGDLSADDGADFANTSENSYHVVTGSGTDQTALLMGVRIAGGNATDAPDTRGGGMSNVDGKPMVANCQFWANQAESGGGMFNQTQNPLLVECDFRDNRAVLGGGVRNDGASPSLFGCNFTSNQAVANEAMAEGGAIYNSAESSPVLGGCSFLSNLADNGGAILMDGGNPILDDCSFNENVANQGGAIYGMTAYPTLTGCTFTHNGAMGSFGGGAMFVGSQPVFVEGTFLGNRAAQGGGILSSMSDLRLTNCMFSRNAAGSEGGGLFVGNGYAAATNCTFAGHKASMGGAVFNEGGDTASITFANCILWANGAADAPEISGNATVSYSCVEGGLEGTGNIASDPMFVSTPTSDSSAIWNGDSVIDYGDLHLSPGSPCIDAGDNAPIQATGVTADLDSHPRFQDDPSTPDTGNGTPPLVDMGCFEY